MIPKLVIASHDAESAEIIAAWLQPTWASWSSRRGTVHIVASGPAFDIFRRRLGSPPIYWTVPPLLACELVLVGSSGGEHITFEREVIRAAREARKHCAVWWTGDIEDLKDRYDYFPNAFWVIGQPLRDRVLSLYPKAAVVVREDPRPGQPASPVVETVSDDDLAVPGDVLDLGHSAT